MLTRLSNAVNHTKILANDIVCNTCLAFFPGLSPGAVPFSWPKAKEKKTGSVRFDDKVRNSTLTEIQPKSGRLGSLRSTYQRVVHEKGIKA